MKDLTAAAGAGWAALEARVVQPAERRFDWKHGWIPLTPEAVAIKLHHAHGSAAHVALANEHSKAAFQEAVSSGNKPRALLSRAENAERLGRILTGQGNHEAAAEHFGRAHGLRQAAEVKVKAGA